MKTLCVIGLGYVGLPLACLASKFYEVIGYDINKKLVEDTNKGIVHFKDDEVKPLLKEALMNGFKAVSDESFLKNIDIWCVCVPTPVDENHTPDLKAFKSAANIIKKNLKNKSLVIFESTVSPGTIESTAVPIIDSSGLNAGTDYLIAHAPERIDPGNKKWNVSNIPRVVGGVNEDSTKSAAEFYRSFLKAEVFELSDIKTAEAVKIVENSFRDINIAFVNELAMSFDKLGLDISSVIKGASTKPYGFMPFYPGVGVGGHCIAVDPYYLIEKAKSKGFNHKFMSLAREINNNMPKYSYEKISSLLKNLSISVKNARIAFLGLAFKKNVSDVRESPAIKLLNILREKSALIKTYDPFLPELSDCKDLKSSLKEIDIIVIATDHDEFIKMDYNLLKSAKAVFDGRNCMDKEKIQKIGLLYSGIGR